MRYKNLKKQIKMDLYIALGINKNHKISKKKKNKNKKKLTKKKKIYKDGISNLQKNNIKLHWSEKDFYFSHKFRAKIKTLQGNQKYKISFLT